MMGNSAIFEALAILIQSPKNNNKELQKALQDLIFELENSPTAVSVEFAPFVYFLVTQSGSGADIQENVLSVLKSYTRQAAMRTIPRNHVMPALIDLLSNNDVRCVLLKGAAMEDSVYPKEAFRLGCDIDVLVNDEDYSKMERILADFARSVEKTPGQPAASIFAVEKTFLVDQPGLVQLDIHREVTVPFVYSINYGQLFGRCKAHPAYDSSCLVLSDEDNLLQFAMHSFYDMQMQSKQTVDAYQLLATGDIDWVGLRRRAVEYRALLPLKYLLEGIGTSIGYPPKCDVPDDLSLRGARKWLAHSLLNGARRNSMNPGWIFRVKQVSVQMLLSGNISGWMRYYFYYSRAKLKDAFPLGSKA